MTQEHEKPGTRVPAGSENFTPGDARAGWRDSKLLAAGEIAAVLLIFVADWSHLIPYSKTPFLFVLGWVSLRLRGMRWRDIGLARFRNWRTTLVYGVAAGIGLSLLELLVTQPLLVWLTGKQPDLEDFRQLTGNLWLLLILVVLAWVQAGIGEEGVYRGCVMNRVADLGNRGRGAWITSLILVSTLFGFAHTYQGITGVIEAAIAGLLFGLLYFRCGRNLAVPIIAHGLSNTVDFVLIFLGKYPGM
jgi:membrane protease YdiL (CAAX protease family)